MAWAIEEDEDEDELIYRIEDELGEPLTDPIKESTIDYYLENKDKVCSVGAKTDFFI